MIILVHVTFDLINANTQDYFNVRNELVKVSLKDWTFSDDGRFVDLPQNTFLAKYIGDSPMKIRDAVANNIKIIFERCEVKGKIFVSVGTGWAWGQVEG